MEFPLIQELKKCTFSDYGNNFLSPPSRIIPTNILDNITEGSNLIPYITPLNSSEYIIREINKELPEPSADFNYSNTLLKSILYLSNIQYYQNVQYPKKADMIIKNYLRNLFEKYTDSKKENSKYKGFIQIVLNNINKDLDPSKNPHFSKFITMLEKEEKCNIIIIRSNVNGTFFDTVPCDIPDLTFEKSNKLYYILLQKANGLFSPYGLSYGQTTL